MKNPYTEYTEKTRSFTEYFSVCLCVISVKLCVQNGGFFSSLLGFVLSNPPEIWYNFPRNFLSHQEVNYHGSV